MDYSLDFTVGPLDCEALIAQLQGRQLRTKALGYETLRHHKSNPQDAQNKHWHVASLD